MEKETNGRILWIDELRGFALVAMILHHIAFNIVYFVKLPTDGLSVFLESGAFRALQLLFIGVFLGLSGVCSHLSRRPLLRAGRVILGALAVTAVTYFVFPDAVIWFGVLHCLGVCMLLAAALGKYGKKVPPIAGVFASLLLFAITYRVPDGFLLSLSLPRAWYAGGLLTPFGFADPFFQSMDYVPLLPHIFLFSAGFFLGNLRLPKGGGKFPVLGFLGRHSLKVYLLHQPILFGIFFFLEKIIEG